MSRRFRLHAVERLREEATEQAGVALRRASAASRDADLRRDDLTARLLAAGAAAVTSGEVLAQAGAHREHLATLRLQACADADAAAQEVDAARSRWIAERARLRGVQALHERHRQAVAAAARRAEQRELDELAATRGSRPARGAGAA